MGTGSFGPAFNLAFDVVGSPYIHYTNSALNCSFSIMEIIIALFTYISYSWRIQIYAMIAWYLLCLLILLICIDEGPRYLLIKKNNEQKVLQKFRSIAKYNGKDSEEVFPPNIELTTSLSIRKKKQTLLDVFKHTSPRNRFLLMCPQFFITVCVYYGVSLGMAKVGGSIQLNSLLGGIFEALAYISCAFLVNTKLFGRKYTLLALYSLAAFGFIMQIIFEALHTHEYFITIMVIIRKFGISGCFLLVILFSSELFASEIVAQL